VRSRLRTARSGSASWLYLGRKRDIRQWFDRIACVSPYSNTLAGRFARGIAWALVGTAGVQMLAVVASVVTARLLGKTGFGEFGIINSTLGTFGTLAGLGLGVTATKFVAETQQHDRTRAGRILGLSGKVALVSGTVVSGALYLLAPFLAVRVLGAPHLVEELRIACILLLMNAVLGVQTGGLAGLEAFRAMSVLNIARAIVNFPAIIIGILVGGVYGAVIASVLATAIACLFGEFYLRRECSRAQIKIDYRDALVEASVLWKFAIPAFLAPMVAGSAMWIANTLLVHHPGGYGELGIFHAANQWRSALLFFPTVVLQVALPLMASSAPDRTGSPDYQRTLILTQSLTVLAVLPAGACLMFLADWIMPLYGADFAGGDLVLLGVIAAAMISSVGSATGPGLQAQGKMWIGLLFNVTWGASLVGVVWWTAEQWGAVSLAFGSVVAYTVLSLSGFVYLAPELPAGMFRRFMLALGFVAVLSVFCWMVPVGMRHLLALPVVCATMVLCMFVLSDRRFADVAIQGARLRLGAMQKGAGYRPSLASSTSTIMTDAKGSKA
jgi:O-antigen/teichoic acid export membrane protein